MKYEQRDPNNDGPGKRKVINRFFNNDGEAQAEYEDFIQRSLVFDDLVEIPAKPLGWS